MIGVDLDDAKLATARKAGAAHSINTAREDLHARLSELTGGRGPDVVIEAIGLPELVINARTDVFLYGIGEEEERFAEVIGRAEAYAEAGATSLFVPGLLDLAILEELVKSTPLPINAMAGPGAPSIADLERVGVRRVSLGTAVAQAAYGIARRVAVEALEKGTFEALDGAPEYGEVNSQFPR